MGLLMDKFCQILDEFSVRDMPIFLFPDNNLSKYPGILIKLGKCIDIRNCFGIANERILSVFDRFICLQQDNGGYYRFYLFRK